MKVALVYDRVNKWGGAERVLLALHALFPDAPLYTSVYQADTASWAKVFTLHTSFLQRIPFARSSHEYFPLLMPLVFESFSFDEYDVVISVTSEAAKGILTKPGTLHINYCLTPTRYLWSGYETYFSSPLTRFISNPAVSYLRQWDKMAAQRPDIMIAISEEVKNRIQTYYQRKTDVIYPPLMLPEQKNNASQKGTFFLVVSRLSRMSPHKKIEIAIDAANALSLPLKVVGDGDLDYFQKRAGKTVEIVGSVSDKKLVWYYEHCKALIFPGIEDFGLVMAEAQRFGKPVIAYHAGGAKEIVKAGKTGEFFSTLDMQSLTQVLAKFDERRYNTKDCTISAQRFSFELFKKKFLALLPKI